MPRPLRERHRFLGPRGAGREVAFQQVEEDVPRDSIDDQVMNDQEKSPRQIGSAAKEGCTGEGRFREIEG